MISLTECSQRLWSATRHLRPGTDAEALVDARIELAKAIYKTDGQGFPAPSMPTGSDLTGDTWSACVSAAKKAEPVQGTNEPQKPLGTHYLLCPGDPAADVARPLAPAASDGTTSRWGWAFRLTSETTELSPETFGPLRDVSRKGAPDVTLYCYTSVDEQDAALRGETSTPGLYPKQQPSAARGVLVAAAGNGPQGRGWWAVGLGVGSLVLAVYVLVMVYATADLVEGALASFRADTQHAACFQQVKETEAQAATGQGSATVSPQCADAWREFWKEQKPTEEGASSHWTQTQNWFWSRIDQQGQPSLLVPLILSGLAILLGVMAASLAARGTLAAALIDERYRISLSRMQQIGWTVLIFGGYFVLVVFNTAFGAVTQDAFPTMNGYLWAALGITAFASPFFSSLILRGKDGQTATDPISEQVEIKRAVAPDPLEKRTDPSQARWTDLFMGESVANKGVIDISRLQSLIITVMLMAAYLAQLIELVRAVSSETVIAAAVGFPVFPQMPDVSMNFVGLLAASHGGYLAFKLMPKANPASGN